MAAEVHALAHLVDNGTLIREAFSELLGRLVDMEVRAKSSTLYTVVTENSNTAEHRLLIDVLALKYIQMKIQLRRIEWIPGKEDAADVKTKEILSKKATI